MHIENAHIFQDDATGWSSDELISENKREIE